MMVFQKYIRLLLAATAMALLACHKPYLENPEIEMSEDALIQNSDFTNSHFVDTDIALPLSIKHEKNINGTVSGGFISVGRQMIFATHNGFIYTMNTKTFSHSGHTRPARGISARPFFSNNRLYLAAEWIKSGLSVYDFTTKKVIWEEQKGYSASTPIIWDNRLFIARKDGRVRCLNSQTFQEIWHFDSQEAILNNLAFDQTYLYALTAEGKLHALVPESGTQAWVINIGEAVKTSAVILDGHLMVAGLSGKLYLINKKTQKFECVYDMQAPVFRSPSAGNNLFYVGSSNGRLIAFDPTLKQILWEQTLEGPPSAPALILRSKIVIGTDQKRLYILDQSDGAVLQELKIKGRISCLPLVSNGSLIIGMDFRKLVFLKKSEKE